MEPKEGVEENGIQSEPMGRNEQKKKFFLRGTPVYRHRWKMEK
jgi:hypothetical protein